MVNWITQCTDWLSTVLPTWNAVLQFMMEYTWSDLIIDWIITPMQPTLGQVFPQFFTMIDVVFGYIATTQWGQLTIIHWLIMSSSIIMVIYMGIYFIKWIVGIFT